MYQWRHVTRHFRLQTWWMTNMVRHGGSFLKIFTLQCRCDRGIVLPQTKLAWKITLRIFAYVTPSQHGQIVGAIWWSELDEAFFLQNLDCEWKFYLIKWVPKIHLLPYIYIECFTNDETCTFSVLADMAGITNTGLISMYIYFLYNKMYSQ